MQIKLLKEEEKRTIESSIKTINVFIDSAKIYYHQMAALVTHLPEIQEAVSKKDRNFLIDRLLPAFNYLKENFSITQFHFHITPTVSFLRLHDIENFGDDISKDRKTVVQVEKTQKGIRGIEIDRDGLGVRGVEPIFYRGKYIGSVEVGGGLKKEIDQIKKAIDAEVGLVLYKELLSSWSGLKDLRYTFGDWVSLYFTANEPKIFISEASLKKASQSEDKYYVEKVSQLGKEYIVVYSPFKDFSGKTIGFVYFVKESIISPVKIFKILGINIVICIIILIVTFLLAKFMMNKYLINPLVTIVRITEEISMGKISQKLEVKDAVEEIAILGKSIERIRITMKKLLE
ncbi:MAG: cache domain-containing protein [Thermodesulfovibrio sp.]